MLYPTLAGIPVFLMESYSTNKQLVSAMLFAYAVFTCAWTTLFYISWLRYESELQIKWGVFGKKIYKEDRYHCAH